MKLFSKLLPTIAPVGMILEIGCDNLTWTTPMYRTAFPNAMIHCFDPDPRNAESIRSTGAAAKLSVNFHAMAVADKEGDREFWMSECNRPGEGDWTVSGSVKEPASLGDPKTGVFNFREKPITVQCTTVDLFCASYGITAIDLLHIDVQGAEDLVLKGAKMMFHRTRYVYAEHNTNGVYKGGSQLSDLQALLPDFEIVECWPYDVLFRNTKL